MSEGERQYGFPTSNNTAHKSGTRSVESVFREPSVAGRANGRHSTKRRAQALPDPESNRLRQKRITCRSHHAQIGSCPCGCGDAERAS